MASWMFENYQIESPEEWAQKEIDPYLGEPHIVWVLAEGVETARMLHRAYLELDDESAIQFHRVGFMAGTLADAKEWMAQPGMQYKKIFRVVGTG